MTIRLVLADDQGLVRGAMSALLNLEDDLDVVAEVGRGDDAVDAVLQHEADVAVLDIEMPGLTGIEVTEKLRDQAPWCKALLVTTFGRPGYVSRALAAGACGFVVKDSPANELADAVRAIVAGKIVVDPALAVESMRAAGSPLTERERDVLREAETGATVKAISDRLHLSVGTTRNYLSSAISKTHTTTRVEAAVVARDNGWL